MHLPDLQALLKAVQRLDSLLTDEYEALKTQKIDAFDALQQEKMSLLQTLAGSGVAQDPGQPADPDRLEAVVKNPLWNDITEILERCKRSHQRNELLISKQLDAIKGALSTLQNQDPAGTLELYTKLGRVKSSRRSILSGDA
ncbi:MAG: flagellar protein FlgN [Opitutae bacterium]|jgi:flagellar biosynthesis/type III secretory pathway chaperone